MNFKPNRLVHFSVMINGKTYDESSPVVQRERPNLYKASNIQPISQPGISISQNTPNSFKEHLDNLTQNNRTVSDVINDPAKIVASNFQVTKAQMQSDYDKGIIKTNPLANYGTYDEYRTSQSQYGQDQIAQEQSNVNRTNQLENETLAKTTAQIRSNESGLTTTFAQGREGVVSTTNPMIANEANARFEADIRHNQETITLAQDRRTQAIKAMEKAQETNDIASVEKYQSDIIAAEKQITDAQTQNANLIKTSAETALTYAQTDKAQIDNVTILFAGMGDSVSKMTPDQLTNLSTQTGLDYGILANLQAQAVVTNKLQGETDQIKRDTLQTQLDTLKKQLPTAGMTADQQNWEAYQSLSGDKKKEYLNWLAINKGGVLTKWTDANGIEHIGAYNSVTNTLTDLQTSNLNANGGNSGTPRDALAVADGTVGGQCGRFVNQYTGLQMGDTYESKLAQTDPALKGTTPQPGDVFVRPYVNNAGQEIGHTGFVVGVSADGKTTTVKDSNWGLDEKVQTHDISTDSITGLIRPGLAKPLDYKQYGLLANTDFNPDNGVDAKAKAYLDYYIKNGTYPTSYALGMGRTANSSAMFSKAAERAQQLYYDATGSALPDVNVLKNNKVLINGNNKLLNNLNIQEGTVGKNFALAIQNIEAGNINQYAQPINAWLNAIKNAMGDPDVAQYITQNGTLQNEVGNLISIKNASGTTVADKLASAGLIPKNASEDQQKKILKVLLQEAENGMQTIKDTNGELYKQIDPLETEKNNPNRISALQGAKDKQAADDVDLYEKHVENSTYAPSSLDSIKW